jgi:hypothetical protein
VSRPFDLCICQAPVVLKLIEHFAIPVNEASIFSPLLQNTPKSASLLEVEEALTPYALWENNAPTQEVRRTFRALGMPRKQYEINIKEADKKLRLFAFGNSKDVAVGVLGEKAEVAFSRPLTFSEFLTEMMRQVGPNPHPAADLKVLRLNDANFSLICRLIDLGLPEKPMSFEALWPTVSQIYSNQGQARSLFQALVDDQVFLCMNDTYEFAPGFVGWIKALRSGCQMQVERKNLPGGKVSRDVKADKALFLGALGDRCSMLPSDDGSGDFLLCRPSRKDLRTIMGVFLGEMNSSRLALNLPISSR